MKKWSKKLSLSFTLLLIGSMVFSSGAAVIAETTTEPLEEEVQLKKAPEETLPEAPPVLDVPETTVEETESTEASETLVEKQETQEAPIETEETIEQAEEKQETDEEEEPEEAPEKDSKRMAQQDSETGDFKVTGGTINSDYNYSNNVLTFTNSGEYSVSGTTTEDRIVIAAQNVALTLDGVKIDVSENLNQAALLIDSSATATIILIGENELISTVSCAGLQNNNQEENSLIINSGSGTYQGYAGSLKACGRSEGAGIGGGKNRAGVVTINGGTIYAASFHEGPSMSGGGCGIGGGSDSKGVVTINGGNITAEAIADQAAAGIGGSRPSNGTIVTINGGTITATGRNAAGVGRGADGTGIVNINGGSIKAMDESGKIDSIDPRPINTDGQALALCDLIPFQTGDQIFVGEKDYQVADPHEDDSKAYLYMTKESHTITVNNNGQSTNYFVRWNVDTEKFEECDFSINHTDGATYSGNELILGGSGETYEVTMRNKGATTTKDRIKVAGKNIKVELNDVKIDTSENPGKSGLLIESGASAEIFLVNNNELKSGLDVAALQNDNADVDSLKINSDKNQTGGYIGSLVAETGNYGAGIGGAKESESGVTINGGNITASSEDNGAGIGGGSDGKGTVMINGGNITASSGNNGAGIGGGTGGKGTVTINGGNITADNKNWASGIGGGSGASGTVKINGGTISTTSGSAGTCIGNGYSNENLGGEVTINGGSVKATGGRHSINPKPKNQAGEDVLPCDVILYQAGAELSVGGQDYHVAGQHAEDTHYYLYMTQKNHKVTLKTTEKESNYQVLWDKGSSKFILLDTDLVIDEFEHVSFKDGEVSLGGSDITYNISMKKDVPEAKTRLKVTGKNIKVNLNNVNINLSGSSLKAAMSIADNATATVSLIGKNILQSGAQCAGLQNDSDIENSLVIKSETGSDHGYAGSLEATGGKEAAGIGGRNIHGGIVTIEGGNIIAKGGNDGSGIGGGEVGVGTVSISGGNIIAEGGAYNGAGIGGGNSSIGNVTINGGTVTAIANATATGIGDGNKTSKKGKVIINGGSVKASDNTRKKDSIDPRPENGSEVSVALCDLISYKANAKVSVDDTEYRVGVDHKDDEKYYLYMTKENHQIKVEAADGSIQIHKVRWDTKTNKFVMDCDFEVEADDYDDVTYSGNELILGGSGKSYTISMREDVETTKKNHIKVTGENVTVKLNGVKIDLTDQENQAALLIDKNATATIDLIGKNNLESGKNCAGLQNDNEAEDSLIITSGSGDYHGYAGSLQATGGAQGAGIGGGNELSSAVTINGGDIQASTSNFGAGIGGGRDGNGIVKINGGNIVANSGYGGAGIGGGPYKMGKVIINGGTVTAKVGSTGVGVGIGDGIYAENEGTVTINGGTVKALNPNGIIDSIDPRPKNKAGVELGLCNLITVEAGSQVSVDEVDYKVEEPHEKDDKYYLYMTKDNHIITVKKGDQQRNYFVRWDDRNRKFVQGDLTVENTTGVRYKDDQLILGGSEQTYTIAMAENVDKTTLDSIKVTGTDNRVKLSDVTIDMSDNNDRAALLIESNGPTEIDLVGENKLESGENCAGIQNNNQQENSLRITSETGMKKEYAGSLDVTGGKNGAGIGGGHKNTGSTVTIDGGAVTATGGTDGAGIGGGFECNETKVIINGGKISSKSTTDGSGIGGGTKNINAEVIINGGNIEASGGNNGSGIGGGLENMGATVTINKGLVEASGASNGSGIGAGSENDGAKVIINGGTIDAYAGYNVSGIGNGKAATNGSVEINGGSVKAINKSSRPDSIEPRPTNKAGEEVGLCNDPLIKNDTPVLVDDTDYNVDGSHKGDGNYYLYMTKRNHTIKVKDESYFVGWHESKNKFTICEFNISPMDDGITYENSTLILGKQNAEYKVTMRDPDKTTKQDQIKINQTGVTVNLKDAKIDTSAYEGLSGLVIESTATAKINLIGENLLKVKGKAFGLENKNSATDSLIIDSEPGDHHGYAGKLTANGGSEGAGISSGVTINGGEIVASGGAGIGGRAGEVGDVIINGGVISATGESSGAGIGGGSSSKGMVTITGGKINATGGGTASGIGGGSSGSGAVTIDGGSITATGGLYSSGIGGGMNSFGTVTINGGTITAKGGNYAAAIGNGHNNSGEAGKVRISSGSVKALDYQGEAVDSITPRPTNADGESLGLYKAEAKSYTNGAPLKVGNTDWKVNGKHDGDDHFYLYLPEKKHVVTVGENESFIEWQDDKFAQASTYTLSIPPTVNLKKEGNEEDVKLTNNFHDVPGYTKKVAASLSPDNELSDNNLTLKNNGDKEKRVHSFVQFSPVEISFSDTEKSTKLKLGAPKGIDGNEQIQAGTYKGTLIFEAKLSDGEVKP